MKIEIEKINEVINNFYDEELRARIITIFEKVEKSNYQWGYEDIDAIMEFTQQSLIRKINNLIK